mgnify:CR=1 FL=1
MNRKKAVIAYVPEDVYEKLIEMARTRGSSLSQVVREIILKEMREWRD